MKGRKNMNVIDEVLTFAEAETIYGLAQGTLRKYLHQTPKEKQRIKEGIDYRKSGKVWIVTRESMQRIYSKRIK